MKTLVSCKPTEFLKQTNRIRKSVQKWMDVTDIINIRNRVPQMEIIPIGATEEERFAINERNTKARKEQVKKNAIAILDEAMDRHADESLEILALCCFIEPKDIDNHTVSEYLNAFTELISDESVVSFFSSLVRLEQMNTRKA